MFAALALCATAPAANAASSIMDTSVDWPTRAQMWRVVSMRDHNTRVVVAGTTLLGIAAGVVGTFAYLRKRAMIGDALSHATLPGIAAAFLITQGKQLSHLLIGASITGVLGILAVMGLRKHSRLKEDAAIGIVLSVFFGAGMVLVSVVQEIGTGQEAGLTAFIYGKAASMITRDVVLIAWTAAAVIVAVAALHKELRVVCFDQAFAASQGWPVGLIDLLLMALVVLTTVIGLQAVGLILIVALLIIPAAAARFWTDSLVCMTLLAAAVGGMSGLAGSMLSALFPRLPAGAMIVISAGVVFFVSMFGAPHRGVISAIARRWSLRRKVADQHLLRALAEVEEEAGTPTPVTLRGLLGKRSWSSASLRHVIRRAARRGLVRPVVDGTVTLTAAGRDAAFRVLRNHRLWEMYLIRYADVAPSHVDRDADEIEHVLSSPIIAELEAAIADGLRIPPSPHSEAASP